MSKIPILLFILLFTFCAPDEKNEFINEDGVEVCDEDQKTLKEDVTNQMMS